MQRFKLAITRLATVIAIALFLTGNTFAHIQLLAPDGGEQFEAGTTVTISWQILISHGTQNWDVWYSVTGDNGPWIPISIDLPAGDTSENAIHTYSWTVPATVSGECRIRVRQDNSGTDWEDVSDSNFAIIAAPTEPEGRKFFDGVVLAGQLSDVYDSDNQYYELDPSPTMNPFKQKIHLALQSTSPVESPEGFSFRVEAAMLGGPPGDVIQQVHLYNYTTGTSEMVDIRAAANFDDSLEITPTGDLSRFVQPITKEITAEIIWTSNSFAGPTFTWSVDLDEAVWLVSD